MKKNNYENVDREKRNLKAAIYIRVGSIEQLSLEAEEKCFNFKMESFQKEEECNADSSSEKEKSISYIDPTGIELKSKTSI